MIIWFTIYNLNEIESKKDELNKLNQDIKYGKGLLDSYRIKLENIEELERMGFGALLHN